MNVVSVSVVGRGARDVARHLEHHNSSLTTTATESVEEALERVESAGRWPYYEAVVLTEPEAVGRLFGPYRERWPDVACFLYADALPAPDPETPIYEYVPDSEPTATLTERVVYAVTERTHVAYPLPENEKRRLESVGRFDVESLVGDPRLETVAEDLAEAVGAPFAGVSLMGAHMEHFLAFTEPIDPLKYDRQDTVCSYTLLGNDSFVVEDLTTHPMFATGQFVEAGIRAYAGVPIRCPSGMPVGAVCVVDTEPRLFTDDERTALWEAAATAERALRESLRENSHLEWDLVGGN
ncbi:GAF domain-containing protein [Halomarina litorea]|uniref:GAF domain-containing protein n=1 Tax=Halomarina litorea TaxID=2961595 RepID=UPI0020C401F7|nr:GAF domain-containing protein [Halomarina sp. BCD28]